MDYQHGNQSIFMRVKVQKVRQVNRQIDEQTGKRTDRQTVNKEMVRERKNRQTSRQIDEKKSRRTDRQMEKQIEFINFFRVYLKVLKKGKINCGH